MSEDEIVVSDCELQDISVAPLINALYVHKTFAVLDLSHNLLGNNHVVNIILHIASRNVHIPTCFLRYQIAWFLAINFSFLWNIS